MTFRRRVRYEVCPDAQPAADKFSATGNVAGAWDCRNTGVDPISPALGRIGRLWSYARNILK